MYSERLRPNELNR